MQDNATEGIEFVRLNKTTNINEGCVTENEVMGIILDNDLTLNLHQLQRT